MTNLFTLCVHHGGHFQNNPEVSYVGGSKSYYDNVDLDRVSLPVIWKVLKKLRYVEYKDCYFLIQGKNLHEGLRRLSSDADCLEMVETTNGVEEIELFIEHTINQSDIVQEIGGIANQPGCHDAERCNNAENVDIEVEVEEDFSTLIDGVDWEEVQVEVMEKSNTPTTAKGNVNTAQEVQPNSQDRHCNTRRAVVDYASGEQIADMEVESDFSSGYDSVEDEPFKKCWTDNEDSEDDALFEQNIKAISKGKRAKKKRDKNTQPDTSHKFAAQVGASLPEPPDVVDARPDMEANFAYDSEDIYSLDESSEDENGDMKPKKKKRIAWPQFDAKSTYGNIKFEVNQVFPNLDVFKDAIADYAVFEGKLVFFAKNDPNRCRAKCPKPCPFVILCSWAIDIESFQVKTCKTEHTCCRTTRVKLATSKWLAQKLVPFLRSNCNPTIDDILNHCRETYNLTVARAKAYKAWHKARAIMEGNEKDQFSKIWNYCQELKTSNPGTTIQLGVERPSLELEPYFDRLYICLSALKQGFVTGCRPMIGLDGCHLKGYYGGILLSAVGQDGNFGFYPIAVVIVDLESKDTWRWFLTQLMEDLNALTNTRFSFMSDQQKGLGHAINELFPGCEHRNCARHIYINYAKKFKGRELRDHMMGCSKATTMIEFNARMQRLKDFNEDAWKYLAKIDPKVWTRAAFSTHTKSAIITNNMCEQFNSKIVKCRRKPIITMLEDIRLYIVSKMTTQRLILSKTKGTLCPKVHDKLETTKKDSGRWLPTWMGDPEVAMFEVECKPQKFKINLKEQTCSCRVWDLTGVPCVHVISAMGWINQLLEDFVHAFFTKDRFAKAYEPLIQPINGPNLWPETGKDPVLPPTIKRPPGRPKRKRKKDMVETEIKNQDPTKMKRRLIPTCSKCKQKGHNMRSCKGPSRGQVSASTTTSHAASGLRRSMAGVESGSNAPMAGATSQAASVGAAVQHGTTASHSKGSTKTNASNPSGRKKTKTNSVNWTPYVVPPPQQNMSTTPQLEASYQPKLPSTPQPEKSPWRGHQCTTAKSSQAANQQFKEGKRDFVAVSQESTMSNNVQS